MKIQLHNRVEHLLKPNTGTSQYLPGKAVEPCDFMQIILMPTIASCWFTELSSAIITTPYKTGMMVLKRNVCTVAAFKAEMVSVKPFMNHSSPKHLCSALCSLIQQQLQLSVRLQVIKGRRERFMVQRAARRSVQSVLKTLRVYAGWRRQYCRERRVQHLLEQRQTICHITTVML